MCSSDLNAGQIDTGHLAPELSQAERSLVRIMDASRRNVKMPEICFSSSLEKRYPSVRLCVCVCVCDCVCVCVCDCVGVPDA